MMKTRCSTFQSAVSLCAVLAFLATAASVRAGKLGSFERSVGGGSKSSSSDSSSDGDSGSLNSYESGSSSSRSSRSSRRYYGRRYYYDDPHYYDCWYCRYHRPCLFHYHRHAYYYDAPPLPPGHRQRPGRTNEVPDLVYEPVPGDPILPMVRFDFGWQAVESDVQAFDYAFEAGFSAIAVRGRTTHYKESNPDATLDLSSVLVLYRIPLSPEMELDAGLGGSVLEGNDRQSGVDFSLAFRVWVPHRHVGFEYRGEFMDIGDGMSSHDFSVLLHARWLALRAGYRWLHSTGDSLDGPFAGVSLVF